MSDTKSIKKGSVMDHAAFSTQPHSGLKSLENSRVLSDKKQTVYVAGQRNRQVIAVNPSAHLSMQNKIEMLLPPLHETSFDS
jgi:hypothetical protein